MTHPHDPSNQRQADELAAFGDALVEGHPPPAKNDIERAMVRAYRAASERSDSASMMPTDVKRQIWEELMTSYPAANGAFRRVSTAATEPDRRESAPRLDPAQPGAPRIGWHRMASFTLVLAVLAALATLAWQQGTGMGPDDPPSTAFAAQGLYDSDDPSTFPMMPETCVANGEIDEPMVPADRSIDDWVAPEYAPARAVPHEQGLAIQETYLNYLRCERDAFDQQFPPGATPPVGTGTPVPPLERSPAMLTYFSDRLRFDHMYGDLSPEQQAELNAYRCQPRIDPILHTFPLPVNQPPDYAVTSLLANGEIDELAFTFGPSDVYLLPDGRYAAIQGTVTTAALTDPNAVTGDDNLVFIAFVEEDGRFYIDEIFTLLAQDMNRRFPTGRNGTLVMDCD